MTNTDYFLFTFASYAFDEHGRTLYVTPQTLLLFRVLGNTNDSNSNVAVFKCGIIIEKNIRYKVFERL